MKDPALRELSDQVQAKLEQVLEELQRQVSFSVEDVERLLTERIEMAGLVPDAEEVRAEAVKIHLRLG